MNENKRFVVNNDGEIIIDILSHIKYDTCYIEGVERICDKMNDLEEMRKRNGKIANRYLKENEELKKRVSDLQKENYGNIDGVAFYKEENATLCEKISDLEYENEELKKENKELQITKNFWKEQCSYRVKEHKNHYSINHCRCTADDFIHELTKGYKGLQKENEELKQQLADIDKLIYDLGHNEMQRQYKEIIKENGKNEDV